MTASMSSKSTNINGNQQLNSNSLNNGNNVNHVNSSQNVNNVKSSSNTNTHSTNSSAVKGNAIRQCIKQLTIQNESRPTVIDTSLESSSSHESSHVQYELDSKLLYSAMVEMMSGEASHAQIGAFLSLLSHQRLTPFIISVCASAMRSLASPCIIKSNQKSDTSSNTSDYTYMDIVGTGGDGLDTFNVSTTSSLLVSACGQNVVKHGNRSSSSKCGSADLLESCGVKLELNGEQACSILAKLKFCFLYAPNFHTSMSNVSQPRKDIGIKTIFNVLGPLTNPITFDAQNGRSAITYQMSGVYNRTIGDIYAKIFQNMQIYQQSPKSSNNESIDSSNNVHSNSLKCCMLVCSAEGMDELSPSGPSHVWIINDGKITESDVHPTDDFGLPLHPLSAVASGDSYTNVQILHRILAGEQSAYTDYVLLNTAAALVTCEKAKDYKHGVELARQVIKSGEAKKLLHDYIEHTQSVGKLSILQTIAAHRLKLIEQSKQRVSAQQLLCKSLYSHTPSIIPIIPRLKQSSPMALIAEIKRASPSLGDINASIDPVQQALKYAYAGASAISVLTEPKWFKGSIDDLRAVRRALNEVPNRPAVLLKDFVLDEYQLIEARTAGADTALLIVALLSHQRLGQLIESSRSMGMEPLVEVANEQEMSIAIASGAKLIGVNNRDLHSFNVDTNTTLNLAKQLQQPANQGIMLAALSGIKSRADVEKYARAGAQAVLVGEYLMKSDDPSMAAAELLGKTAISSSNPSINQINLKSVFNGISPLVKICGVRTASDAICASEFGADIIGIIFAKSKRQTTIEECKSIVNAISKIERKTALNKLAISHFNQQQQQQQQMHNQSQSKSSNSNNNTNAVVSDVNQSCVAWLSKGAVQLQQMLIAKGSSLTCGVFADQTPEFINAIVSQTSLDLIQLHGSEGFDIAKKLNKPCIRQIPVTKNTTPESILHLCNTHSHDNICAILLDTKSDHGTGGTGQTFDWSIAARLSKTIPIMVAGGLTPDNVAQAQIQIQAMALDTASGVEGQHPGVKDHEKVKAFAKNAKQVL